MTKRILIVRLSAIGDSILSVPVLNALRRHMPEAKIGWVIEHASSQLIQGHTALDEMFTISKRTLKSPRELWSLALQLRRWKPDITIDLQGLTKSSLLAWLSGAKTRLGFRRDAFDGRELSTFLNNTLCKPDAKHLVDRSLEILRLMGISDHRVEFELPESDRDADFADKAIRQSQLEGRFAIINVGAGWVSKIWPAERYASVARHLDSHWGVPSLVVWAGADERRAAEQVVELSEKSAQLAPATTLQQLGSLIRRGSLFVGSDTGPMHLAVAVGTPTIGMIGPMPIERVRPYGARNLGIQRDRLAEKSDRKTDCRPMLSILPQDVQEACDRLMGEAIRENTE